MVGRRAQRNLERGTRKSNKYARVLFGFLTAWNRGLPDFIVIGGQRCGSTSLFSDITAHPCVLPPLRKEILFFDRNYRRGLAWYRAHFPSEMYKSYRRAVHRQDVITGEASTYYLIYPHAARRVRSVLPGVKLIAMLRNPVDRAYSHYNLSVRQGRERRAFEEAIATEQEMLPGEMRRMVQDESYYSMSHFLFSYLSRGMYADQLQRWLEVFPREQILIVRSEDYFSDQPAVYGRIVRFLGLPDHSLDTHHKLQQQPYTGMPPAVRARLVEFFRPHNQRLRDYLGLDFSWDC